MQGMKEPDIFLKEGNSFGIGELRAEKVADSGRSERGEGMVIKWLLREERKERKNSRRGEMFDCTLS